MKKMTLILIFFSLIFASELQYDECKTDVYYANGINTKEWEAQDSLTLLEKNVRIIIYDNNETEMSKHIGKFYLAYNQTTKNPLLDLIESTIQKTTSDANLEEEYEKLSEYYKGRVKEANESNKWFFDLYQQIEGYKKSIKNYSHRVLIVAHSQGNLFTYQAYKLLEMNDKTKWMTNYMYVVSIASPLSSDIIPNTPVVCFDNDLVCKIGLHSGIKNPVRQVNWSCDNEDYKTTKPLLSNYLYENEIGKEYNGCTSEESFWGIDWKFNIHAFSYYMGENVRDNNQIPIDPFISLPLHTDLAKNQILSYIKQGLEILSKKPSMWKILKLPKKEYNCEQIRATLIHKYEDLNVTQVYPFNTHDFKLYPVKGEYVIAKCGGENIEDIQNSDDNKCYILQPTKEIIYKYKKQCGFYVSYKDKSAFYNKDTFFTVASNGCSCFPYNEYTFYVKYYNSDGKLTEDSWTASRHTTHTWTDACGDVLQIGNGAGHRWIHGGINFYIDMKE